MAQFDPALREETRFLDPIGKGTNGQPVYRQANFVMVKYDGDPDEYLEPLSMELQFDENTQKAITGTKAARIAKFEIVTGRPFPRWAFWGDNLSTT